MPDEIKQPNKTEELKAKPGPLSISDSIVFKDNSHLVYLYKKTERLVSALYLLSSLISDKEPVKWQMREAGINLLSHSLALSDRSSSGRRLASINFISTGFKFLSFLEVCRVGEIISEMNYNILKYEFESLIQAVESGEGQGETKGLVFPDHFFEIAEKDILPAQAKVNENTNFQKSTSLTVSIDKGQKTSMERLSVKKEDKSNRQDIIINLLKTNKELGIKDFTSAIKGCSEKTIQRELVALVSKGLIRKEGEKRWSRYSLVNIANNQGL